MKDQDLQMMEKTKDLPTLTPIYKRYELLPKTTLLVLHS